MTSEGVELFWVELGESSFGASKLVGRVGAFFGGYQFLCEGWVRLGTRLISGSSVAALAVDLLVAEKF